MPMFQERQSKRFHVTLQVSDLNDSIRDYREIFGEDPCYVIPGYLGLWRTGELNFLLWAKPKHRTAIVQFGWEFDYLDSNQRFKDCNQLSWLFFSAETQNDFINRLKTEPEYREDSDFPLELRNPNARWNLWASLVLVLVLLVFTVFNNGWLKAFFRPAESSVELREQVRDLQDLYSASGQLEAAGKLLEAADYEISYLDDYAVAQHDRQASITFQVVDRQILFVTHWALRQSGDSSPSQAAPLLGELEIQDNINKINRDAVLCRYYQDEDGDLAVEAWFALPSLLLLPEDQQGDGASESLVFGREQAGLQWQKILALWQQESLSWIRTSPLFGGSLDSRQSFSKK
ncbi:hypothetical protein P0082_02555 [Candidatus Haliotispira prima]|uniref:VOC domain-containing protein n=1 Tax=Candidatus Haliotispira prima TaxID=3034016 RepID=A0ABY8MKN7_9SPIO|nr:hypothetical protein P0082_02555 [Candidatus Haliotispira prima]